MKRYRSWIKYLDLHGMRHEEARKAVITFIEKNWDCGQEAHIITGNSRQMIKIVKSVLDEYRIVHRIGGAFGESGYVAIWL